METKGSSKNLTMANEHFNQLEKEALDHVSGLFNGKLSDQYEYHNFTHTLETTNICKEIANSYQLDNDEVEILLLACIFHDSGYVNSYENHEEESVVIAEDFLKEHDYAPEKIEKVKKLIISTTPDHNPGNLQEEIIHDADFIHMGKKNFFDKGKLLRKEWEYLLNKNFSNLEWEEEQYRFLTENDFYTTYARGSYGKRRLKNIKKQKQKLDELKSGKNSKNKKAKKQAGRGIETMYRSTYRNHINLSSIADNKANMMISINTIILSIIITVLGSGLTLTGNTFVEHIRFTLPIAVLLVTCLISAVFAVFSARPSITNKKIDKKKIKDKKTSLLFFGNFTTLPLNEYIEDMNQLMNDEDLLYDNMTIDIYFLGKVLTRKYRLLRFSYNIFMTGLIISVLIFIVVFIVSYGKP